MDISPVTRKEHFLARAAGDEDALELQPVTREEHLLQKIIDAIEEGGSGSVTPASIVTATGQMDETQKTVTRANLGAGSVNPPDEINIISATPEIEPVDNTIYNCGELTSLTISNPPATGSYSIVFTSGATATSTTIPATILGLEDFAAEANTMYEINVLDNRAVVGSWAVSSGE